MKLELSNEHVDYLLKLVSQRPLAECLQLFTIMSKQFSEQMEMEKAQKGKTKETPK